jgi:hypothetical protein
MLNNRIVITNQKMVVFEYALWEVIKEIEDRKYPLSIHLERFRNTCVTRVRDYLRGYSVYDPYDGIYRMKYERLDKTDDMIQEFGLWFWQEEDRHPPINEQQAVEKLEKVMDKWLETLRTQKIPGQIRAERLRIIGLVEKKLARPLREGNMMTLATIVQS